MSDMSQRLLPHRPAPEDTDWRAQAACRDVDPELFFPVSTSGASVPQIEDAKQVCRTCPVCGGPWSAARTLVSGAAPPRTSGARSGCSARPYEG
jgi:hypothetical protein